MNRRFLISFSVLLIAVFTTALPISFAATDGQIFFNGTILVEGATCETSALQITQGWIATTQDFLQNGQAEDATAYVVRDGDNRAIATGVFATPVGSHLTFFDSVYLNSINPIQRRPLIISLHDISGDPAAIGTLPSEARAAAILALPLLTTSTFDPASVLPNCANLPNATVRRTIIIQINNSMDDAFEVILPLSSTFSRGSLRLPIGSLVTGRGETYTGLRFKNVNIPQGALIINARLEMFSTTNQNTHITFRIMGEGNSAPFSLQNRLSTRFSGGQTRSIRDSWSANSWISINVRGIISGIINQPRWVNGNSLSIIFFSDASRFLPPETRRVMSYNGSPARAPRLVITFEE